MHMHIFGRPDALTSGRCAVAYRQHKQLNMIKLIALYDINGRLMLFTKHIEYDDLVDMQKSESPTIKNKCDILYGDILVDLSHKRLLGLTVQSDEEILCKKIAYCAQEGDPIRHHVFH